MKLNIIIFLCCCLASYVVHGQNLLGLHDLAARDGLRQRAAPSSVSSHAAASSGSSIILTVASATSASVAATDASSIASGIGSPIGSVSTTGTDSTTSASISVDPRSPAGGVSMITPALTASESYIKVGDYATFSWTYTSLIITPSAVNVEAYCSLNSYYYPIAENMTINDTEVVWNTSGYQATATIPLLVAQYTLFIYDAASNPTVVASAGQLAPYNNLYFGVYTPQPYTPLNNYQCPTCSASYSLVERGVLRGTLAMTLIACIFTVVFMMR
ncbi:hypothetical protein V1509DRAFT_633444 [Lipomyces kononenkoae]